MTKQSNENVLLEGSEVLEEMAVDSAEEESELESQEYAPSFIQVHEGKFDPDRVKFLVYGDSGAGKTRFASTFPDPIFLDIDKGMSSIDRLVHRVDINKWSDMDEILGFLLHSGHPFKTVVVDSLNELQYILMRGVIEGFPNIRRSYENLASQSDYGKMLDDFEKKVRLVRALPLNVVLIAQVATREYETDPVKPQFVGKHTANLLTRMMDVVGFIYKVESDEPTKPRSMVFDAVNYTTKDRSGRLPQIVPNPDYETLYRYWTQGS